MTSTSLETTARALVKEGQGILAADESTGTIKKRLDSIGVESTEDTRRAYRELLFSTKGAGAFISGTILFDETIRQSAKDGTPFVEMLREADIIPGIKVDAGAKPLAGSPDEKVTEGLDGLRGRLEEYRELGARFAKWRAVITIGEGIPTPYCIETNAHALARYAALCQEAGLVPIVEPEVLMDWKNDIDTCERVTGQTLHATFAALHDQCVSLEGMLLKPNMVISGKQCPQQAGVQEVAEATIRCFKRHVPAAVPGIVFLSGGQSDEIATAHLNAMNSTDENLPWKLSFSYGRALQHAALTTWKGEDGNVAAAQKAFLHRAKCNGAATTGSYSDAMEKELVAV